MDIWSISKNTTNLQIEFEMEFCKTCQAVQAKAGFKTKIEDSTELMDCEHSYIIITTTISIILNPNTIDLEKEDKGLFWKGFEGAQITTSI